MNLIQVYASTADKQDSDDAQFYEQLRDALKTKKMKLTQSLAISMPSLDVERSKELIGKYDLGNRNARSILLGLYHQKHIL
jgi:hypothetical protein